MGKNIFCYLVIALLVLSVVSSDDQDIIDNISDSKEKITNLEEIDVEGPLNWFEASDLKIESRI